MNLRRRWPRVAAAVGSLVLVTAFVAGVGGAQTEGDGEGLVIRRVDTTAFPEVTLTVQSTGARLSPTDFTMRENGRLVDQMRVVPLGETDRQVGIAVVVDTSGSMRDNDAITQARDAISQFAQQRRPNEQIAVVSFDFEPSVLTNFTTDTARIERAIDGLAAGGGTALWDGVRQGVGMFERRPELQRNLILLSDGGDTHSSATFAQAEAAALDAKVAVFVVGLVTQDFEEAPLRQLAERTGGVYTSTTDPEALRQLYTGIQETLQNQYDISYTSSATEPTLELALTGGGARVTALTNIGSVAEGTATQPRIIEPGQGGILSGSLGKALALGLAFLAAALFAFGIVMLFVRERTALQTAMIAYEERPAGEDFEGADSMVETRFMQGAIAATGRFAEARGFLPKVERALEKADLPLRAPEALFFYAVGVVIAALLLLLLVDEVVMALLLAVVVAVAPPAVLAFLAGQRQRKFTAQLPDTLQLLSGSLRAGYSLMQGVEAVSQEVQEPMGRELRRVLAESRLGRPLEDALDDAASRMESKDFAWAVMAIKIQREVGGNLAELLQTVGETMLARERLRREVRALTAEGRMSAIVLGLMPVGLLVFLYFSNRSYIETLFNTGIGQALLIGAAVMGAIGVFWMKKTIEIEV